MHVAMDIAMLYLYCRSLAVRLQLLSWRLYARPGCDSLSGCLHKPSGQTGALLLGSLFPCNAAASVAFAFDSLMCIQQSKEVASCLAGAAVMMSYPTVTAVAVAVH
jgi:hypothetical protein